MRNITPYVFEKLKIDSKAGFAKRFKGKVTSDQQKTKTFKEFFKKLKIIAGLYVEVGSFNQHGNYASFSYKIRSEEPDKIVYKSNKPKTWDACMDYLFDVEHCDLRTADIILPATEFGETYYLSLGNLDDSEIKELTEIGFIKLNGYYDDNFSNIEFTSTYKKSNFFDAIRHCENDDDLDVIILFPDLYNNIEDISKYFFD